MATRKSTLASPLLQYPVTQQSTMGIGNPTGDTLFFAIKNTTADPVSGDWIAGQWYTSQVTGANFAQIQIGPGTAVGQLATGRYWVWIKIVDSAETIVQCIDELEIT